MKGDDLEPFRGMAYIVVICIAAWAGFAFGALIGWALG